MRSKTRIGMLSAFMAIAMSLASIGSLSADEEAFHGPALYRQAVEAVLDTHLKLADPAARKQFSDQWLTKYDNSGELNTESGVDDAINTMVQALGERYDGYFDKRETAEFRRRMKGEVAGIGVELHLVTTIAEPAPSAPAADGAGTARDTTPLPQFTPEQIEQLRKLIESAPRKKEQPVITKDSELLVGGVYAGSPSVGILQDGDRIIAVDGTRIEGMLLDDAADMLRGKAGTVAQVTILRALPDGTVSESTVSITRATTKQLAVSTKDLGDGISYIKLDNFMSETADEEMAEALKAAAQAKGIIIDLRDNLGGELEGALRILSNVLPEGTMMSTRQRDGDGVTEESISLAASLRIDSKPSKKQEGEFDYEVKVRAPLLVPRDRPVVVLVNENSASASEIVAGALQAHKRVVIVGKTTRGKGVGQGVVELKFDRQIHVTTFEFLPGGKAMHKVGIIPDVDVADVPETPQDEQVEAAIERLKLEIAAQEQRAATVKAVEDRKLRRK